MNSVYDNSLINEILRVTEDLQEDSGNDDQHQTKPDKKEQLLAAIKEKIIQVAKNGDFTRAESYRQKVFQKDPGLLKFLHETGQIIAEEKRKAQTKKRLDDVIVTPTPPVARNHWQFLSNLLPDEEYAALLGLLKPHHFNTVSYLLQPGQMNSKLFFIHQGFVTIYIKVNGKKIAVKTLGSGSICGVDSFLSGNVTQTYVEVSQGSRIDSMEKAQLAQLLDIYPTMKTQLFNYITDCDNDADYSEKRNRDRRLDKRFPAIGNIGAQLIDVPNRKAPKMINGSLINISHSGVAFQISTSHANPTILLKGKKAHLVIGLDDIGPASEFLWGGSIVDVSTLSPSRYSIHLHGEENNQTVKEMVKLIHEANKKFGI